MEVCKMAKEKEKKQKVVHIEERRIKLTNAQLTSVFNSPALQILVDSKELTPKITFDLMLIVKEIQEIMTIFEKVRMGLIEKYGDRDKENNLRQENSQYMFSEHRGEFDGDIAELMEKEVYIPQKKLSFNVDDLPMGVLSAKDMLILDPVVNFMEE
jgi:hypothetical protein